MAMHTILAFALVSLISQTAVPATQDKDAPAVKSAAAPAGAESLHVEWIRITTAGSGTMLAAVARPDGAGPFPAIVLLHGSHGFAQEYVRLAQAVARGGFVAVAPCWFSDGGGPGARFVTTIPCAGGPSRPDAASRQAQSTVDLLLKATRTLPGVRSDRVALFGHSRGAGTALNYVLRGGLVQAAVLCSSGYSPETLAAAAKVRVPILILHGVEDGPADGGSEFTNVRRARDFEAALRRLQKPVDAKYYEGGGHNGVFTSSEQFDDEVQQIVEFLKRNLKP
jgi:dienelactone hydrolase